MATETLTLFDLGVVLIVAAVALLGVRLLRQPMVLGYLIAGALVGPSGPSGLSAVSPGSVETLAELGVLFIMVGLGLEFSPRHLRRLGAAPVGAAIVQILLSYIVAHAVARWLGFEGGSAVFVAAALSISSTIVAVKVLEERREVGSAHGRLAIGILLVQDIAAIAFLGVAEGLSVTGSISFGSATPIVLGLLVFTVAALVIGALLAPRLMQVASRGPRELLLIVVLGLVFGMALLADHFGFSVALGAFIVGAIIAETRVVTETERLLEPLKHMFTAVFFVSIGMLIDVRQIFALWDSVLLFSAVVIVTRAVGAAIPAFLFGVPARDAVRGGATIGQIGEFSFIVITSGLVLGLVDQSVFAIFVGVAAVTTLLTPYAISASLPVLRATGRLTPAPLRTYAEVYTGWVQRLGEAEETERHRRTETMLVRRIVFNLVALLAIGAVLFLADRMLADRVLPLGGLDVPAAWAVWPFADVIGIPFLLTVWSATRELIVEIVLELVPDRVAEQAEPPIALKVVRASLGLVLALTLGAIALAFAPQTGTGGRFILPIVFAVVLLAGVLLWRRIQYMHAHVEGTIENLFGVTRTAEERDEVLRLIGRHYTVSLETKTVVLPEGSPIAHHQIRDAQVRNRTGATIVSVERDHERYVNPPPSLLLLPGDHLLLMGESQHVEKAQRLIETATKTVRAERRRERESRRETAAVRSLILPTTSPAVGKTIAGLELRARTGASIVAALRDHDHIQNPTPNFTLRAGDRLFLLGTDSQLDAAETLLGQETHPAAPDDGASEEQDRRRASGA